MYKKLTKLNIFWLLNTICVIQLWKCQIFCKWKKVPFYLFSLLYTMFSNYCLSHCQCEWCPGMTLSKDRWHSHETKSILSLKGAFSRLDPTGEWTQKLIDVLPTGRLGEIPEIANLVCYMVSDYSSWMTGEVSYHYGILVGVSLLCSLCVSWFKMFEWQGR